MGPRRGDDLPPPEPSESDRAHGPDLTQAPANPTGISDQVVIAQVLEGETQAFELLIERYKAMVGAIVAGKVPRDQAPEVAHEVFIRAFESLGRYRPLKPFGHWLSTLAVRTCHDYWRRTYGNREVPVAALSEQQQAHLESQAAREGAEDASSDQERFETWEMLDWALGHLSPGDRLVLTLVHLEGHSVTEAAALLGWSAVNVKVRAHRARQKMRKVIMAAMQEGKDG